MYARRRLAAVCLGAAVVATGCTKAVAGRATFVEPVPTVSTDVTPPPGTGPSSPAPSSPPPSSPAPSSPAVPSAFVGVWLGQASQPGGRLASWTAGLTVHADGHTGTFLIGSVCVASTEILTASATTLRLRETVRRDQQDVCADSGVITLTPAGGGKLAFRWVDDAHPDNVATGTLSRDA